MLRSFRFKSLLSLPVLLLIVLMGAACAAQQGTPVVIEKEIIKEVPVIVEKEVIKEVPVQVVKEVIKEVPVQVVKEVTVETVKEVKVPVIVEKQVKVIVEKEVIVEKPVETEVIKEVVVVKEVPVEIVKEVIVEKIVEKEVPVETTVVVEKSVEKEVVTTVQVEVIKQHLETPKIESVRWKGAAPSTYTESPQNAKLSAAGTIPALSARLPKTPLLMHGPDGVGKHGLRAKDLHNKNDMQNCCMVHDGLVDMAINGSELEPNVAKSWEVDSSYQNMTFHLREGHKWSDGTPLTSADYLYAFKAVSNKELFPNPPGYNWGGVAELPKVTAADDYTVTYAWGEPYPAFLNMIMIGWKGGGSYNSAWGASISMPSHHMKQFFKGDTDQAGLDEKIKEGGYDDWVKLFKAKLNWVNWDEHEVPVLGPWYNLSGTPADAVWRVRANPYHYMADSAGNQLPYFHEWVSEMSNDANIMALKQIAGGTNFQRRGVNQSKLTLFMLNRGKYDYDILFTPSDRLTVGVSFNLSSEADSYLTSLMRKFDYRLALSHAIDREEVHMSVFDGLGYTGNAALPDISPYYLGKEFDEIGAAFDKAKATSLLDGLGLKKDADGFYLRADNGNRIQPLLWAPPGGSGGQASTDVETAELIVQHWANIGIDAKLKVSTWPDPFNLIQMNMGLGYFEPVNGGNYDQCGAVLPHDYYESGGTKGIDPATVTDWLPGKVDVYKSMRGLKKATTYPEIIELGKVVVKNCVENIYMIGVVKAAPTVRGAMMIVHKDLRGVPKQIYSGGGGPHMELLWFDTPTGSIAANENK